jgi:hemerythrin
MTMIIEAGNIPQVELAFMNNTHFEEIEMVKSLGELISNYQQAGSDSDIDTKAITDSLQQWLSHTIEHFERENELMQATGFPALSVHSNEHEQALKALKGVVDTWQQSQNIDLLTDFVFDQWPNWFNAHVGSMDMVTAKFAVMNGYSE